MSVQAEEVVIELPGDGDRDLWRRPVNLDIVIREGDVQFIGLLDDGRSDRLVRCQFLRSGPLGEKVFHLVGIDPKGGQLKAEINACPDEGQK